MTFLVIYNMRHWLSISNLFEKSIKVKQRQCPDYIISSRDEVQFEWKTFIAYENMSLDLSYLPFSIASFLRTYCFMLHLLCSNIMQKSLCNASEWKKICSSFNFILGKSVYTSFFFGFIPGLNFISVIWTVKNLSRDEQEKELG